MIVLRAYVGELILRAHKKLVVIVHASKDHWSGWLAGRLAFMIHFCHWYFPTLYMRPSQFERVVHFQFLVVNIDDIPVPNIDQISLQSTFLLRTSNLPISYSTRNRNV